MKTRKSKRPIRPKIGRSTAKVEWAADVTAENVLWAFKDRIPLGSLTLIVGPPGQGKSTIACDLAARWSRGEAEGNLAGKPSPVLIASAEDNWASVLRPRLEAAKADLSQVGFVEIVSGKLTRDLRLPQDLPIIRTRIKANKARVLIIDPLVAHLNTSINSWSDQSVRTVLAALGRLAEELMIAVICIVHLNKSRSSDILNRVSGSVGFVAAARSVLFVARDHTDPEKSTGFMLHVKSNLSPLAPPVKFGVEQVELTATSGDKVVTSAISWLGEAPGVTSSQLLSDNRYAENTSEFEEAAAFLKETLSKGQLPARDVLRRAREAGISERTLRRAKAELGIVSAKSGYAGDGVWCWMLPEKDRTKSKDSQLLQTGHLKSSLPRKGPANAAGSKDGQNPEIGMDKGGAPLLGGGNQIVAITEGTSPGPTDVDSNFEGASAAGNRRSKLLKIGRVLDWPAIAVGGQTVIKKGPNGWKAFVQSADLETLELAILEIKRRRAARRKEQASTQQEQRE